MQINLFSKLKLNLTCFGYLGKLRFCKRDCKGIYCHDHKKQWLTHVVPGIISFLVLIASLDTYYFDGYIKEICIKPTAKDIPLNEKKEFEPIFKKNDSLNFKILIIRFEDYIADKETYCIGRSIEENILASKAKDTSLHNISVKYVVDSIPPPRDGQEAMEIKEKHNADLIIYGLAKNIMEDCKGADVCFRYNLSDNLIAQAKPAIEIKKEKFDLEYIPTTPTKIELGQFSIDHVLLSMWVSSLAKLKLGNVNKAFIELDQIASDLTQTNVERSKRLVTIASTYFVLKQYNRALESINKSLALNPENYRALQTRANIYTKKQEFELAKNDLNEVLNNQYGAEDFVPYDLIDLLYREGNMYFENQEYEKAIKCYKTAIEQQPRFPQYYTALGDSYLRLNQPDSAIKVFDRALKTVSGNPSSFYNKIATAYTQKGFYYKAIEFNNMAISSFPTSSSYYLSRGLNKLQTKDYFDALADLDKSIEMNPNRSDAYRFCVYVYRDMEEYDMALAESEKLIKMYPERPTGHSQMAYIYALLKNPDSAIYHFTEAILINPDPSDFYFQRSKAYLEKKDFKNALNDCVKALKLSPKNTAYKDHKTAILFRMGDYNEFNKMFKN